MSSVNLSVDLSEIFSVVDERACVRWFGTDLLDHYHDNDLIEHLGGHLAIARDYTDSSDIDTVFLENHPNPTEVLEFVDDDQIIDYLINKGYNIEM